MDTDEVIDLFCQACVNLIESPNQEAWAKLYAFFQKMEVLTVIPTATQIERMLNAVENAYMHLGGELRQDMLQALYKYRTAITEQRERIRSHT